MTDALHGVLQLPRNHEHNRRRVYTQNVCTHKIAAARKKNYVLFREQNHVCVEERLFLI